MHSGFRSDVFERHRGGRFGVPLRAHAVTGSTNADALAWAGHGAPEGAVVVADAQSAGRGRWGRAWIDRPGESLLFSVVLRPVFPPARLTTALGVAVSEGIEAAAGGTCRIKWPNDVTIDSRKVAGILVESRVSQGRLDAAVAGVGVNVSWREVPPEISDRATSLLLATGASPGREELLAAILSALEPRYDALAAGDTGVVVDAAGRSEILGSEVRVVPLRGEAVVGRAVRLEDSGALVVATAAGEVVLDAGEVKMLR